MFYALDVDQPGPIQLHAFQSRRERDEWVSWGSRDEEGLSPVRIAEPVRGMTSTIRRAVDAARRYGWVYLPDDYN